MHLAISAATAVGLIICCVAPAQAHAQLERAEPPVGGAVQRAPTELRITFSEAVEAAFSTIALAAANGAGIALDAAKVDPHDGRQLVAIIPAALAPGEYRVSWRAVSVDTHRTEGGYSFTVAP